MTEKEYVDSITNVVFALLKRVEQLDEIVDHQNVPVAKHIEEASFQMLLRSVKQAQLEMNTVCLICSMWKHNVQNGREKP